MYSVRCIIYHFGVEVLPGCLYCKKEVQIIVDLNICNVIRT